MTPLRAAAVTTVTTALALYTAGALGEQRTRRVGGRVRLFLTAGVVFDVTATILMIVASGAEGITLHGVLGYSALALMLSDTLLLWRHWSRRGAAPVGHGLHLYSRFSYLYWVAAYFTGAALVMASRAAG
jgi:hypothetical protein